MMDTDQAYTLGYTDGEDFDIDFKHVRDKNETTASLSAHKRGGTF